jgi:hypothetical protein
MKMSERLAALHLPEPEYPDGNLAEWHDDLKGALTYWQYGRDYPDAMIVKVLRDFIRPNMRAIFEQLEAISRLRAESCGSGDA